MEYVKKPMDIEVKSFEIIDEIITEMGKTYPADDALIKHIYRRAIHTSADFDYLDNLRIEPLFLEAFEKAIGKPLKIYTDTNMALSGINKSAFSKLGWELDCLVNNPNTFAIAKEKGITRSMVAIDEALKSDSNCLFIIGNAPTAIFRLLESNHTNVIGVIGVPVGFVGAAESKEALLNSDIPCITALGRKGGSNVAASILNALMYHHLGRD